MWYFDESFLCHWGRAYKICFWSLRTFFDRLNKYEIFCDWFVVANTIFKFWIKSNDSIRIDNIEKRENNSNTRNFFKYLTCIIVSSMFGIFILLCNWHLYDRDPRWVRRFHFSDCMRIDIDIKNENSWRRMTSLLSHSSICSNQRLKQN